MGNASGKKVVEQPAVQASSGSHPAYLDMIETTLWNYDHKRKGLSRLKIAEWIDEQWKLSCRDEGHQKVALKRAFEKGTTDGRLLQSKQSFKLSPDRAKEFADHDKKRSPSPTTSNKPKVKVEQKTPEKKKTSKKVEVAANGGKTPLPPKKKRKVAPGK